MTVFVPTRSSVQALGQLAMQLFNRQLTSANGLPQNSITIVDKRIVVRETAAATKAILDKLRVLDESLAPVPSDTAATMHYTPRALSVQAILEMLNPLV